VDLGTMTVSLQADLSGLKSGLERAQELIGESAAGLARQEERFRLAGAAARNYGDGMSRWLAGVTRALAAAGESARGLEQQWRRGWQAMDDAAEAGLTKITRRFSHGIAQMMVDGEGLRSFWRRLWRDLVETAVQRLLELVLRTRAAGGEMREALNLGGGVFGGAAGFLGDLVGGVFGGVGKILGTIGDWLGFDNPVHDAWARKQGFDFGKHFRAGVAAAMALPVRMGVSPNPGATLAGGVRPAEVRAVSISVGDLHFRGERLDERAIRDAGGLIADEVSRRLGWVDRRSGM